MREPEAVTAVRVELGRRLAALRKAAGFSQAAFAPFTAYSRASLASVETGRQNVGRDFWQRADAALGTGGTLTALYDELRRLVAAHHERRAAAARAARTARLGAWLVEPDATIPGNTGTAPGAHITQNLHTGGRLLATSERLDAPVRQREETAELADAESLPPVADDEEDALELARRVAASDVGRETLARLESVVDDLAVDYPVTPPGDLLRRVRLHLGYVGRLIDSRKTVSEHRRLLVVGGWLSLLGATLHIDLSHHGAATARLRTALDLARHAEHAEIEAYCLETEAWRQLIEGNYPKAVALSRAAGQRAPRGGSAAIQAAAQEGRAWARLGRGQETYAAISRVGELVAPMSRPERPEHHYRYDPDKYTAYTATTLAWVGDPAAETYAREVITRLRGAEYNGKWPRRIASANLDLALALLVTNRLDEAAGAAHEAISSGRVVPSNHWRALEVVRAVEARQLPEAKDLREAYSTLRRGG